MYNVQFTKKADKFLNKMSYDDQERIVKKLERIRIRPEHFLERLIGEKVYKLRAGNHRLIIDLIKEDLVILVIEIGHRKNIYKN